MGKRMQYCAFCEVSRYSIFVFISSPPFSHPSPLNLSFVEVGARQLSDGRQSQPLPARRSMLCIQENSGCDCNRAIQDRCEMSTISTPSSPPYITTPPQLLIARPSHFSASRCHSLLPCGDGPQTHHFRAGGSNNVVRHSTTPPLIV